MIAESLAGKRIAITGSTGFVGTALVERLLRSRARLRTGPARPRRPTHQRRRAAPTARSSRTTRSIGSAQTAQRATTTTSPTSTARGHHDRRRRHPRRARAERRRPRDLRQPPTSMIHSAAAVSFDSPLDSRGRDQPARPDHASPTSATSIGDHAAPRRGVDLLRRRQPPRQRPGEARQRRPVRHRHRLAQRGRSASRRLRSDTDAASRSREQPRSASARRPAPNSALPAPRRSPSKTEQLREKWVKDQLVEAGRARAASVGWPDAYAFTKALGEQALTDVKGAVPVSIVRPSIIESALGRTEAGLDPRVPHGRARASSPTPVACSSEFPGVPEGTVDVIPVDIVVARDHRRRRRSAPSGHRRSPRWPPAASTR